MTAVGPRTAERPGSAVTAAMALACGLAVATIYYAQPLLDLLVADFHVSQGTATLLITASQLGYAAGILLVVPLGDLLENRRLVVTLLILGAGALLLALASWSFAAFAVACLTIGVTASVAQVLIPFAANLAADDRRGRVVGQVMSGLLLGGSCPAGSPREGSATGSCCGRCSRSCARSRSCAAELSSRCSSSGRSAPSGRPWPTSSSRSTG